MRLDLLRQRCPVDKRTIHVRVLDKHPHDAVGVNVLRHTRDTITHQWRLHNLDAKARSTTAKHSQRRRHHVLIHQEHILFLVLGVTERKNHGFRGCRALVQQGGICDVEASKRLDHRLVVKQRLKAAL